MSRFAEPEVGQPFRTVHHGDDVARADEIQADYLRRSLDIAFKNGVEAYFPYELQAPEKDPFYAEDHFGLVHRDYTPKPAYLEYKRYILAR